MRQRKWGERSARRIIKTRSYNMVHHSFWYYWYHLVSSKTSINLELVSNSLKRASIAVY